MRENGPLRLSVCVEFLFVEEDGQGIPGAIRRAAAAGVDTVEMWGWRGRDLTEIRRALDDSGVVLHALTIDPLVPLAEPVYHPAAFDAFDRSVEAAAYLGCSRVLVTSGNRPGGVAQRDSRQAIGAALAAYASRAEETAVTVLLEPLNSKIDHPECVIDRCPAAIEIIDDIGSPALQLVYDFYHGHVMGDAARDVLGSAIGHLGHVQLSDVPGRNQPGTGTIDWPLELGWLLDAGYPGLFGLECRPSRSSADAVEGTRRLLDSVTTRRRHAAHHGAADGTMLAYRSATAQARPDGGRSCR